MSALRKERLLRIAVLVDRITPGAAPKLLGREVSEFCALGHDAEAVSIMETGLPPDEHQFDEYLADIPIRYISREYPLLKRFDFRIPPFAFFAAFTLPAALELPKILSKDAAPYDVIVAHGSIACIPAYRVRRQAGIPYLAFLWDPITYILDDIYGPRREDRRAGFRGIPRPIFAPGFRLARRVDQVLIDNALVTTTGARPYAELIRRYTDREAHVVYPGVDAPASTAERRGDFLFTIDRWDIGNMPTWLLDVVKNLSTPVPFKVAGFWWPPRLEQDFRRAVAEHGLQGQVEVLGSVSEAELANLYSNARALIFPHHAGINLCVMEASAHGCPVVMQESIDLFTDGVDGFFPPRHDVSAFTAAVERLLDDERLAYEMGQRGRELMLGYGWRRHAQRLLELIEAANAPQSSATAEPA